jgi:hypothetical protein
MTLIIGVAGAAITLVFFILEQLHIISNDSAWFDGGNFVGSALLVIYAYLLWSIPFLILNTIWAVFSLKDLIVDSRSK